MHENTAKPLNNTGEIGPEGLDGLVGTPRPIGLSADGEPGETKEENLQRWRDAANHNDRLRTDLRRLFGDTKR